MNHSLTEIEHGIAALFDDKTITLDVLPVQGEDDVFRIRIACERDNGKRYYNFITVDGEHLDLFVGKIMAVRGG